VVKTPYSGLRRVCRGGAWPGCQGWWGLLSGLVGCEVTMSFRG